MMDIYLAIRVGRTLIVIVISTRTCSSCWIVVIISLLFVQIISLILIRVLICGRRFIKIWLLILGYLLIVISRVARRSLVFRRGTRVLRSLPFPLISRTIGYFTFIRVFLIVIVSRGVVFIGILCFCQVFFIMWWRGIWLVLIVISIINLLRIRDFKLLFTKLRVAVWLGILSSF